MPRANDGARWRTSSEIMPSCRGRSDIGAPRAMKSGSARKHPARMGDHLSAAGDLTSSELTRRRVQLHADLLFRARLDAESASRAEVPLGYLRLLPTVHAHLEPDEEREPRL